VEALVERLLARARELESVVVQQRRAIAKQAGRIVELERRLGQDSSTVSTPEHGDPQQARASGFAATEPGAPRARSPPSPSITCLGVTGSPIRAITSGGVRVSMHVE
jgi:hypothetical protein